MTVAAKFRAMPHRVSQGQAQEFLADKYGAVAAPALARQLRCRRDTRGPGARRGGPLVAIIAMVSTADPL